MSHLVEREYVDDGIGFVSGTQGMLRRLRRLLKYIFFGLWIVTALMIVVGTMLFKNHQETAQIFFTVAILPFGLSLIELIPIAVISITIWVTKGANDVPSR